MTMLAAMSGWFAPGIIVALSVVAAAATTWLTWREKSPEKPKEAPAPVDHGEAAFDAVAGACKLEEDDRVVVRALAAAHGEIKPIALLISSHAFDTARKRLPVEASPDLRLAARVLRERLYGVRG